MFGDDAGQGIAQFGRDVQVLDHAADGPLRAVRRHGSFQVDAVQMIAGQTAAQHPDLRARRVAVLHRDRQRQVAKRQHARRTARPVDNLDRAVFDRHVRRVALGRGQRKQTRHVPGTVRKTHDPQRRTPDDDLRDLGLRGGPLGQFGRAAEKDLFQGNHRGARTFRAGLEDRQPSNLDPFALHPDRRADGHLQAAVVLGKQPLDVAADPLVHPLVDVRQGDRRDDRPGDDAPLEEEPTEVDQALDDEKQPSVAGFVFPDCGRRLRRRLSRDQALVGDGAASYRVAQLSSCEFLPICIRIDT